MTMSDTLGIRGQAPAERLPVALEIAVLDVLTDRWETATVIAARLKCWQKPTVRAALLRMMRDGRIAADQRLVPSISHRRMVAYKWVFRQKS